MTHHADAEQLHQLLELVLTELDRKGKAFIEQAARRAPAAPVQEEPTSKQVVLGAGALLGQPENTADNRHPDWHSAVAKARSVYLAMLAAAPQPPEAAPVQLPEPSGVVVTTIGNYASVNAAPFIRKGEKLFTEQQVRELLAAHGIGGAA